MPGSKSDGLWWQKSFPVEGDSAVAEFWTGEQVWGEARLEKIHLDKQGEQRIEGVKKVLTIFPPKTVSAFAPKGTWWELDAYEVTKQIQEGSDWLIENEKGRMPE